MFTFVIIFTKVDIYLLILEKLQLRTALLISVFVKALLQLYPGVELMTGMASIAFVEWVIGKVVFISAYFITVTDGLLLSLLVAIITLLINFVMNKRQNNKAINL